MQLLYNILSGVPRSRSKGFLSYKLLGNLLATCAFWSNFLATFAICNNLWELRYKVLRYCLSLVKHP